MKNDIIYNRFLEAVKNKISKKLNLTNVLVDILYIEKEAVYRRLRGEVPFTFAEIATISTKLGISLDNVLGTNSERSRPFQLKLVEYLESSEIDYFMMQEFIEVLKSIEDIEDTEQGEATNVLPQPIAMKYEHLSKFYVFKWKYQHGGPKNILPYRDIEIGDRLRILQLDHVKYSRQINNTYYIFDNLLFYYLIHDLKYYASVHLMDKQDIKFIIKDLYRLLEEMEEMTETGIFKETGKKVQFYISDTNLDTNYSFIKAMNFNITLIRTFILNGIASLDDETYEKVKNWIQSLKRQSTLISESGEKQRTIFFNEQKELFHKLESSL